MKRYFAASTHLIASPLLTPPHPSTQEKTLRMILLLTATRSLLRLLLVLPDSPLGTVLVTSLSTYGSRCVIMSVKATNKEASTAYYSSLSNTCTISFVGLAVILVVGALPIVICYYRCRWPFVALATSVLAFIPPQSIVSVTCDPPSCRWGCLVETCPIRVAVESIS